MPGSPVWHTCGSQAGVGGMSHCGGRPNRSTVCHCLTKLIGRTEECGVPCLHRKRGFDGNWRDFNWWAERVCLEEAFLENRAKTSNKQRRRRTKLKSRQRNGKPGAKRILPR